MTVYIIKHAQMRLKCTNSSVIVQFFSGEVPWAFYFAGGYFIDLPVDLWKLRPEAPLPAHSTVNQLKHGTI